MGEMENQAEFFYEKLKVSINPGQVLLEFYRDVVNENAGRSEIIMINRLVKLFGRFTTYFSIMDLSKYDSKDLTGNLFPLLYTICRSRFERTHSISMDVSQEPLDKLLKELEKEREKARKSKGKIPTSEGL
jgi:hypothetical protein